MSTLTGFTASADPVFIFLLLLPFLVAAAAFLGEHLRRRFGRVDHPAARPDGSEVPIPPRTLRTGRL